MSAHARALGSRSAHQQDSRAVCANCQVLVRCQHWAATTGSAIGVIRMGSRNSSGASSSLLPQENPEQALVSRFWPSAHPWRTALLRPLLDAPSTAYSSARGSGFRV